MKDHDPHIYTKINEFRWVDIIDYHALPLHIGLGGDSHIEEGGTHSLMQVVLTHPNNQPASQPKTLSIGASHQQNITNSFSLSLEVGPVQRFHRKVSTVLI